jgi:hypothetical protein
MAADAPTLFLIAADLVLTLHVLFVAFVIVGLVLIFVGWSGNWRWVRNRRFRILHLVAIAVVVIQSWVGVLCPLTKIEMALRERAGDTTYSGAFIAHWLENILYYRAPAWVFVVCYTMFGALVVASWYWVRPDRR